MKRRTSLYHIMWYLALALTIILAFSHPIYWYLPIAVYIVGVSVWIVGLSIFRGKVSKLPEYSKLAWRKAKAIHDK